MIAWNPLTWFRPDPRVVLEQRHAAVALALQDKALAKAKTLTESTYWTDIQPLIDVMQRYSDPLGLLAPITNLSDRLNGANWPLWRTEQELSSLRMLSRITVATNDSAHGLINGLTAYVLGNGFRYRAVPKGFADQKTTHWRKTADAKVAMLCDRAQAVVDEFAARVMWSEWEDELFRRSRRDGEYFLRLFTDDATGRLDVRVVEPEQIQQPANHPGQEVGATSFGIIADPDDVQTVQAYYVRYPTNNAGEFVDPDHMDHCKINVDRVVKRGCPDFAWDARESLNGAAKLLRNLREGGAIQAAIAAIREHATSSQAQVTSFVAALATDATTLVHGTTRQEGVQKIEPGTVLDVPAGLKYVPPPGAANVPALLELTQALRRSACARWNAPEWLGSADASNNNYASSLTAESPFTKAVRRWQSFYKLRFARVIRRAIQAAMDGGELPIDLWTFVDLQVEADSPEARNRLEEAQIRETEMRNGVISPQTWMMETGRDPDQIQAQRDEWQERNGPLPGGAAGMGMPSPFALPQGASDGPS